MNCVELMNKSTVSGKMFENGKLRNNSRNVIFRTFQYLLYYRVKLSRIQSANSISCEKKFIAKVSSVVFLIYARAMIAVLENNAACNLTE